jgi:hypothetical protein
MRNRDVTTGLALLVMLMSSVGCPAASMAPPPDAPAFPAAAATATGDASDDAGFPWPPPMPSAREVLPPELFGAGRLLTLGEADALLTRALRSNGYTETSYYEVPGGFAVVTRMEQINDGGGFAPARWRLEPGPLARFSLRGYLEALFTAPRGHYRVIVFVVTDTPVTTQSVAVTSADAVRWIGRGHGWLPQQIATLPFVAATRCTALVYEFDRTGSRDPHLVIPGRLMGRDHLLGAGLWAALERDPFIEGDHVP